MLSSEDNLMALVEVVFIFEIILFLYRPWILKNIVPNLPNFWNHWKITLTTNKNGKIVREKS